MDELFSGKTLYDAVRAIPAVTAERVGDKLARQWHESVAATLQEYADRNAQVAPYILGKRKVVDVAESIEANASTLRTRLWETEKRWFVDFDPVRDIYHGPAEHAKAALEGILPLPDYVPGRVMVGAALRGLSKVSKDWQSFVNLSMFGGMLVGGGAGALIWPGSYQQAVPAGAFSGLMTTWFGLLVISNAGQRTPGSVIRAPTEKFMKRAAELDSMLASYRQDEPAVVPFV